jgi:plastocyanin
MKRIAGIIVALAALIALVVVIVGMQNDAPSTDTSDGSPDSTNQSPDADTDSEDMAQGNAVTIEDFAFTPETITVKKGTTVTWTNNDSMEHTVTGNDGGPDSELFGQGEEYSYTFDEVGTFTYFCKPHPNMTGTVIVEE